MGRFDARAALVFQTDERDFADGVSEAGMMVRSIIIQTDGVFYGIGSGFQVDAGAEFTASIEVVLDCSERWPPETWLVPHGG